MCMRAVYQNGYSLTLVPYDMRTFEICCEAVRDNGYAIVYVPFEKRTCEICLLAVSSSGDYILADIPDEVKQSKKFKKGYRYIKREQNKTLFSRLKFI